MCKTFTEICKMTQSEVKKYTAKQLKKTHENVTVGDGFVYAKGNFPVLLIAHMDTVHKALPRTIMYFKDTDILTCNEGIGGDDRCGIYIILEIVKRYNCSVLFCEDEEIGGAGAKKFIKTEIAKTVDPNYIIEFDRKGKNDAVFYDCDNPEFELFITERFFKTNWGTFSDISILAPFIGVAAVNLSCGYYNAHTVQEYVVLHEMETVIDETYSILERTDEGTKFEYIEAENTGYDWYGTYDGYDFEEKYYLIEYFDENGDTQWFDTDAYSEPEAVGMFLMENPNLTYNHITDVCVQCYIK